MSEKSKGDTSSSSTSRIVNNPLLSANVTNLTFDDFQNKPVILPAAPPIIHAITEDVSESSQVIKRTVTVGETPDIDADTLSEINLNPTDDEQLLQQQQQQQQFDLNYNNAFPQIQHEPRSINNNEIADDSILSQAASSFSQLPSVASTVLSTFSKVINNYSPGSTTVSREQSSERSDFNSNLNTTINNSGGLGYQSQYNNLNQNLTATGGLEQYPESVGFNNQYLKQSQNYSSVATSEPPKLYTPPPIDTIQQKTPILPPPLTAGGNTYRLSSKKKIYAQIPGLSVNHTITDTDNNSQSSTDFNLPTFPSETSNTTQKFQTAQPLNSFLNDTDSSSQSNLTLGNYTSDPYQQQTQASPKSDKSTVGGLFSGVSGVIQNLSGLVKSTVANDLNQSVPSTTQDLQNKSNIQEPQFNQGFIIPPVSSNNSGINATQVFNPIVGHQIGFEPIQSSISNSSIKEDINTIIPPPTKPPTASNTSSFRLQKGTRLYKSPFENTSSSGVNASFTTQLPQQQFTVPNLPLPENFNNISQGPQITENIPPIPAPESFQSYSFQNIQQPNQVFNPIKETPSFSSFKQDQQKPGHLLDKQFTDIPVNATNLIEEEQKESVVSKIQQIPQSSKFFQPIEEPTSERPITNVDFFKAQEPNTSLSVFDNPKQETVAKSVEITTNIFKPLNSQIKTSNITENNIYSPVQPGLFDSAPQQLATQQSQLEVNTFNLSPLSSASHSPFIRSSDNNNLKQFNSLSVEEKSCDQQTLLKKTAELSIQEKQSALSVAPPPILPPAKTGHSKSANPFRRDSTKSHPVVPTNFFTPGEQNPQILGTSLQPQADQINLSLSQTSQSTVNTTLQAVVPENASTVDYFKPVTSDEWAQKLIKEANPTITETSILNTIQPQEAPSLGSSEPFPEKFNFSTLLPDENTKFRYLPPSLKPKLIADSENNCPPPIEFRPPAPLPFVNNQPDIGPGASIAAFYNPVPSHQWAQQVIDAAQEGLNEIPQQENTDHSHIIEGTIEPEEEFPDQFDFSSVLPPEGPVFKYLPPPINNNINIEASDPETSSEKVKILKITKETLPQGTSSCVGEFLTEVQQPKAQTAIPPELKESNQDENNQQFKQTNLANYFGQQQPKKDLEEVHKLETEKVQEIQYNQQNQTNIQNSAIQQTFIQGPPSTSSTPKLTDFFNSNSISAPVQQNFQLPQSHTTPSIKSDTEIKQQQAISDITSVDKNLNLNVSQKISPIKGQQEQNSFLNFFDQQKQQQILSNQKNQDEIFFNNQKQQSQQQQQLESVSSISFFDQFNNNNNSSAQINQSTNTTAATGQLLNEEEQKLQNFFNNPPPQNLNNNSVNELNFKNLYGCGGIKSKQFSNSDFNLTPGKYSDNRSATPLSNIVEPPSSACSEFSSDYINNSSQNLSQQNIGFTNNLNDPYLNEIPEELILEYNKMSTSNATNAVVPCNVVYTPAKKHWFYKKIEQNKQFWIPFTHKDSDALEESFLKKGNNIVQVEGGRYDVNINERTREPIYWRGGPTEVRRCSWFFKSVDSKYVPYEEQIADFLESEYREASNSGEWRKKVALGNGETVVFHAPTVLVHFLQSQTSDAWGGATQATIKPRVVKRDLDDFVIEAGETDKVDHLLFMVHGIGSSCDLKFRSVEEVVEEFRSIAYQLVQAHYKNSVDNGDVGRIEVLPVSWHHELHSAESGIDEQLKAITLESIPKLRNFNNDTVVDALFYTSPIFCQYIINTVANCMNRVYLKFCQRNTNFSGQVSLAGHSLGSLILFDILCNQKPVEDNETNSETLDQYLETQKIPNPAHSQQVNYTFGSSGAGQPKIDYPQLLFGPKKFFALGSPIGLFTTIRGIAKLGMDFKLPTCPGFYNIFHPYDPIAYRIEALINPEFSSIRPVLIPHHKGRKRMHLELKETMTRVGTEVKQRIAEIFKGTMETVFFLSSKNKVEDQQEMEKEVDKVLDSQLKMDQPIRTASSSSSDLQSLEDLNELNMTIGKLNDTKRIDYVLQEAPLEFFNEYLFALTSHVCYWDSEDTILFIVKEIYSSLGISTDATIPQQNMTIERPSSRNTPSSSPTSPQKLLKEN
ncbi:uncharacterized protein LOC129605616 [Condylostylus longicornis]|uniref:uncharacterized protein LOC129605616 n=1 Tax=Condylostylus longicornis TaxID=2530218 RepID=UPI00244E5028|nr:uncharacterized protein LOC129605616 [Condylostylus longicornis]